ncbi:MAG: YggS family pyridoxal phosphate-dependent enzyme [Rickettsiales bacterium]
MNLEKRYKQMLASVEYAYGEFKPRYENILKTYPSLCVVSKNRNLDEIKKLVDLGQELFAENKVQEAQGKWMSDKFGCKLHMIGPLQSNKVKEALDLFDVIESVDREKLVNEICKHDPKKITTKKFYIQVNVGNEPQKSGVALEEAQDFIDFCVKDKKLNVTGLMCIPPKGEAAFPYFCRLLQLAEINKLPDRSMGMSGDFVEAIECGSTQVRIGSAIFDD